LGSPVRRILETSASIFFTVAYPIMIQFSKQDYFKKHAEQDDHYETMGRDLFIGLSASQYCKLMEVQPYRWGK
jgi:hypothetical protein